MGKINIFDILKGGFIFQLNGKILLFPQLLGKEILKYESILCSFSFSLALCLGLLNEM